MKPKIDDPKPTAKPDRAKPDKSKEAKLQRAIDALTSAATAYFAEGETDTAMELRKLRNLAADMKAKTEAA